jgi:protein-arginine kinase activator protein McsA
MKCDVCGNYPIFNVSVIRSEKGDRLNVCNDCIDQITNRTVSS